MHVDPYITRAFSVETIVSITHFGRICKYFLLDNSRQIIISVLKACNHGAARRSLNGRSHSLLVVVDSGGYTSIGLGNAYHTVVHVVSVGSYTVCPVGYADKIVVCIIRLSYRRIIGVNNLGKVTNCIILIANDLAVCIGIACDTVERVVGSCDRAVAVGYSQYVAVSVISVTYSAFGGYIPRNSAHCVIEYLSNLTASVGDLLTNIEFVVLKTLGAARNGTFACQSSHIVIGVVGSTAERSCKSCDVA